MQTVDSYLPITITLNKWNTLVNILYKHVLIEVSYNPIYEAHVTEHGVELCGSKMEGIDIQTLLVLNFIGAL